MKTVAIINQKGGVGKSSTAAAIISGLNAHGFKVLGVDLDPQCSLTLITGAKPQPTIQGLFFGSAAADVIQETPQGAFIAGSAGLANANAQFQGLESWSILKGKLKPLRANYDYCIIDTPPALGILTLNALTAADYIIIPAMADILSLQGISQLKQTIDGVQQQSNPALKVAGILLTRYSDRATLNREIAALMERTAANLNTKVFTARIREAVALRESQATQTDLFSYAPKAKVTEDYRQFINELIGEIEK